MMRTSSSASISPRTRAREAALLQTFAKDSGFSLVEVLVTIAIMALAAIIIMPNLGTGLASASRHALREDLARQIVELRKRAIDDRVTLRITTTSKSANNVGDVAQAAFNFPAGWIYRVDREIDIFPDGFCSGGNVEIARDGDVQGNFVLEPGRCQIRRS